MEWLIVAIFGFIIGTLFSFIAQGVRMPQSLCILLGVVGAVAGASLERIAGFKAFGSWTFYVSGVALAIGLLAGGLLSFTLTSSDKRV